MRSPYDFFNHFFFNNEFCFLQNLRRNLFVTKKSSKQQLNIEIGRHKDSQKKLDEAMKTIDQLKTVIRVSAQYHLE